MIRVIVADDEYKVCQLICQLINWEELGMELAGTASNGIEALKMIEKEKPDLVLTDIRMPGYDGMELLKRARALNPELEFIIISGYSHFEYAQTAIRYGVSDYILKPINRETLNATLQKVRQRYLEHQNQAESDRLQQEQQAADQARLREMLWMDLEFGVIPGNMEELNQKYYYCFSEGLFQTFLIQAAAKDNTDLNEPYAGNVMELLSGKAPGLMDKHLRPLCVESEIFCKGGEITGVLNYLPERRQDVRNALEIFISSLCRELHAFGHMQFHLSTSHAFETSASLLECVSQARLAMGQRLFNPGAAFLEEVPENTDFDPDIFYKPFSVAMRQSLDVQNSEYIEEAVKALQEDARSFGLNGSQLLELVKDSYRLFLLSSVFQNEYHFADREAMELSFNKKAVQCSSCENLFSFLCENCKKNLEEACAWINREKMRPISQAKQYIREHYAEALSLEDVSSRVGFSSSYFSTVFRKETGKTFLEYLMDVRIEEAKTILRESRMTIENVCKCVGYNDYKRFSKTFKKVTGISPKEYRNLYS